MNRKLIYSIALLIVPLLASAQEQPDTARLWKTGGAGSLSFSQVSLVNWAAGGANSVAGNAFLNLFANYEKGNASWDNNLDLGYGLLNNEGEGVRKSDDRIEFSSKYGQKAFKHWFYSGMVNFKTQFADGYKYPNDSTVISSFLAPAYLLVSLGLDFKPSDNFTLLLSPLTSKMTFVNDTSLARGFGLDEGKKFRGEYGGYVKMMLRTPVMTNVDLMTKLDLFSNYADNPQNVDVSWEVLVTMKINEFLSANINTQLVYDDNIRTPDENGILSPRVQFKEVLGIGLSYKF